MTAETYSFLYITCASAEEARVLARGAVDARLAGCGNVFPAVTSIYRWEGKIEEGAEAILILKTLASLVAALRAHILKVHSYKTPCVAEISLESLNEGYAAWLMGEVKPRV